LIGKVQEKTKARPTYANNQRRVSYVTLQSQNFCGKQLFSFKAILFSGAKFTFSDHKTRAAASPIQPWGRGEKISGGAKYLSSFSPNFDDNELVSYAAHAATSSVMQHMQPHHLANFLKQID